MVGSLFTLRYIMIKQEACIIDVLLGNLMRVVAMRLKMELILFLKLYHPHDGTSFTLVSTYLQNHGSGCPSYNPRVLRVRPSHMGKILPLYAQSEPVMSQGSMGIMPLPLKPVVLDHLE